MIGKYEVSLQSKRVSYQFDVKRKYTVIRGDSANGKSELCRLISEKGCTVICKVAITVLRSDVNYEALLLNSHNTIYFVDESFDDIATNKFASVMKNSDNYFVLISRRKLSNIPFSVEEIYTLERDKLGRGLGEEVNTLIKQYKYSENKDFNPDVLITEDSNSGYDFFNACFKNKCISARGKGRIEDTLRQVLSRGVNHVYLVVDGAAFGSEIATIVDLVLSYKSRDIVVYAPESFEYLLLMCCNVNSDKSVLFETYNYCCPQFFNKNFSNYEYSIKEDFESWERFFKAYLSALTQGDKLKEYGKSSLKPYYLRFTRDIINYLKNNF